MLLSDMLEAMTSRELAEYIAYNRISPYDDSRGDLQAAIVASTVANVNRNPKKRPQPYKPIDFMPYLEKPKQKVQGSRQWFKALLGHRVQKKEKK